MKEFRGTPGEWEVIEHSWSRTGIYSGDKGIAALDIYDDATEDNEDALNAEMLANARLMAASKDLLEALQGMMEFAGIIEERLGTAETDKARAAIRKALGEQS